MSKRLLLLALILASCATYTTRYHALLEKNEIGRPLNRWPVARFLHLTDTHVFPAEWAAGATYQKYIDEDPKLLRESQEIFRALEAQIEHLRPDFLILSGDLTKDGEVASHEWLAQRLSRLRAQGIPSYVVPGNHDLNNPDAVRFLDDRTERVPTASPQDFARIYAEHGYAEALDRDSASLSYLAEPVPGLWLLALDSCLYETNFRDNTPYTGGRLRQRTVSWMEDVLLRAHREGKAVIAMLHHPPNEQFRNRERYMKDFVLQHHREVTRLLTAYGVTLVFSGHTHSQDVTRIEGEHGVSLYSVVTGSPVSYPPTFRQITLNPTEARIETFRVRDLPSFVARGESFEEVARRFSFTGVKNIARKTLSRFWVGGDEADRLSNQVADAFLAFWAGDERFAGQEKIQTQGLSFMAGIVVSQTRDLVEHLWEDLPPVDNHLILRADGSWLPADGAGDW